MAVSPYGDLRIIAISIAHRALTLHLPEAVRWIERVKKFLFCIHIRKA
jgi:hypothetical protein